MSIYAQVINKYHVNQHLLFLILRPSFFYFQDFTALFIKNDFFKDVCIQNKFCMQNN